MGRFDELSDVDFEDFVADLMSAETGLGFSAGARGRDRGVDALADDEGRRHVIQCKHYVESRFPELRRAAREEAVNLEELGEPLASYRFITSKPLSHDRRDELLEILEPWAGSRENILGGKELVALLKRHEEVEDRHPKMWFSGMGQLARSRSAASYERSRALLEHIRAKLPRYVQTEAFFEARHLIDEKNVCIVAGPAGIGKTTLAQLLLMDGIEKGFEPFEIVQGELARAWELLEGEERQIFYFDDFLGQTALFEAREQDRDLMRFIDRIARDDERRLVLTTRDYIFNQARRKSEILSREMGGAHQCLLAHGGYSRIERGRIFYNHIYFSAELDEGAKRSLVADRGYQEVVDHPGFNPRVIEWITGLSSYDLTEADKADYARYCLNTLDSPEKLWDHVFEEGLNEHERVLALAFLGFRGRVENDTLEQAFEASCAARGLPTTGRRFQHALTTLDGSLIAGESSDDRIWYSLVNPSLVDYLSRYVTSSRADQEALLRGACFFEQVEWLWLTYREDGALPPRQLWEAYADGFSRLFDGDPLYPRLDWSEESPSSTPLGLRLRTLATALDERWFRETLSPWLAPRALEWLDQLVEMNDPEFGEVSLLVTLLEHGVLESEAAAEVAKARVLAQDPSVLRWELLNALYRACPEVLPEAERTRERDAFSRFLDETFADLAELPYRVFDVDRLPETAAAWDLVIDADDAEAARSAIEKEDRRGRERERVEEAEEDLEWLSQKEYEAELEGRPTPVEEEVGIASMFSRLADG